MAAGSVSVPTIIPLRQPVLGQHKTAVDTSTKIELHSDTDDVTIYYTLNGSKPEPFQTIGPAAKMTFTYREPFRLAAGKRTIKAIAVAPDGRESFVVTKTFDVEQLEDDVVNHVSDDLDFIRDIPVAEQAKREVQKFSGKMVTGREAWAEIQRLKEGANCNGFNNGPLSDSSRNVPIRPSEVFNGNSSGLNKYMASHSLASALQYQPPSVPLKCNRCFAPRSPDPLVKFCIECGALLPALPLPSASNQMIPCWRCKNLVPSGVPKCLICEATVVGSQDNLPPRPHDSEVLVCTICGTANRPSHLMTCTTCNANLNINAKIVRPSGDIPVVLGRLAPLKCIECGRNNNADSRFCDWCGAKSLTAAASKIVCSVCSTVNAAHTQYCSTCGIALRQTAAMIRNGTTPVTMNTVGPQISNGHLFSPLAANSLTGCMVKLDACTQTVGLYYPSQRELSRQEQDCKQKSLNDKDHVERKPLLTALSPGRGYWRKQMEHICGHFKAYAANTVDFRAEVGEPRLGKLISASVDEDDYEFSVTLNFEVHRPKGRHFDDDDVSVDDSDRSDRCRGVSQDLLRTYGHGMRPKLTRHSSHDSLENEENSTYRSKASSRRAPVKRPAKKKIMKKAAEDDNMLSAEDKKLLKAVGKNGDGNPAEIRQLVDEGADPKCTNKEGFPVLHVAVLNGHHEAIAPLIEAGAQVNRKGPTTGNTALHHAVTLGPNGYRVIDKLLEAKADVNFKNDKGESPFDIAVKNGLDAVVKKFAAFLGQSSLGKLTKPRPARGSKEL